MTIAIKHHQFLGASGMTEYAIVTIAQEVQAATITIGEVPLHNSYHCIWAEENGAPRGILVWDDAEWTGIAHVMWSFVEPGFRGHGIYRALNEKLIELARAKGCRKVRGGHNVHNRAAVDAACAVGRRVVFIWTEQDI